MTLQRLARFSLALLLLLLNHTLLHAQKRTVTGIVFSKDNKDPLAGVTVNVKGTTNSVITDSKGYFAITPPARMKQVILTFSFVGFDSRSMRVDSNLNLSVEMTVNSKSMNDVVVIGYGTKKRSDILGSVATINPKELEDLPTANLATALVNQVPGMSIGQTSGKPGATTNVLIRNAVSFNAGTTSPLYIIDGLAPIIGTGTAIDPTGQTAFMNLDPSEIESITVLKDASATIYGARGANGVILVTTKKGRAGPPHVNYSGSYSVTSAAKQISMLDGYDQALLLNNWVQNYRTNDVIASEIYTPADLDTIKSRNFNWFKDEWIPKGSIQKHTLSVSGGTEKLTYFVGGNLYNEIGNLPEVVDTKYGFQLGVTARPVTGMNISITMNDNSANSNRPAPKGTTTSEQSDQMNATIGGLLEVPTWVPESINGNPFYYAPLNWNPIELAASNAYDKDQNNSFSVNANVTYELPFLKGLQVQAQYGRNNYSDFGKQYYPSYSLFNYANLGTIHKNNGPSTNIPTGTQSVQYNYNSFTTKTITDGNELIESWNNSVNWQATEGLSYTNTFGDHHIGVTMLTEQSQTTGNYLITQNNSQVIPNNDQVYGFSQDNSNYSISGQTLSTGRVSYLGRLDYSFRGKYLLEGAFRDDASPNFPTNHQWGFFPSASVGWKISEEKFFEDNVHFLNDLKIRYNMGLTGNDNISSFGWIQRYTSTNGYLFGTGYTNGLSTASVANPNVTWERDLYKDLGLDGTFGNRRFNFTLDYWYRHGYDMLDAPTASVPVSFGASIIAENYAIMNSWGTEASIGYHQDISRDWQVFATVNFNWSDNKVIQEYYSAGTDTGYLNPIGKRQDRGITGYKSTGIVSAAQASAWNAKNPKWAVNGDTLRAGDLNFQDLNGDGQITSLDQTQIAKRSSTIYGFGFLFGAQWKGLRLSTNISLGLGGKMVWPKVDITPPTKDVSSLSMWKGSYTPYYTNAKLPAIYAPYANQASTFWLHSASYMYVNNLMLSWQVPVSWTAAHHIPQARFYMTGNNLWSIINPTPYKDPRSNEITDYPILRNWTFGLNLNI